MMPRPLLRYLKQRQFSDKRRIQYAKENPNSSVDCINAYSGFIGMCFNNIFEEKTLNNIAKTVKKGFLD